MKTNPQIFSDTGELTGVILHQPGPEVENMTPSTVQRSLYSDILNLSIVSEEYNLFRGIIEKFTKPYFVKHLLNDILKDENTKNKIILEICAQNNALSLTGYLNNLTPNDLSNVLIEGVVLQEKNLSNYLSNEKYAILPLHNILFTRDPAFIIGNSVFLSKMANPIRERESLLMKYIFKYHQAFSFDVFHNYNPGTCIEGGDVVVVNQNIIIIGMGSRTNAAGIDSIIDHLKTRHKNLHIIVQELPTNSESFIHLDMVFTMLDTNTCMIYEPVIMHNERLHVVHIEINDGKITDISSERNILKTLQKLNTEITAIPCGGNDTTVQEREQWHSGANFFALAPGIILGYERNNHTNETLDRHGFEIVKAIDLLSDPVNIDKNKKYLFVFPGSELARGGGGPRCMTLPINRL